MKSIAIIYNENPEKMLQVNLSDSVGRGAPNHRQDVVIVQTLLNSANSYCNKKAALLVVDGICGTKTVDAIRQFQILQLGVSDCRIDPGRKTMKSLVGICIESGNIPLNVAGIFPPSEESLRIIRQFTLKFSPR